MGTYTEPYSRMNDQMPLLFQLLHGLAFAHAASQKLHKGPIDTHVDRHSYSVAFS